MFSISLNDRDNIVLQGRLDTASADEARAFVDLHPQIGVIDLSDLHYISSAGLGVLLVVHKRLMRDGGALQLRGASPHIQEVMRYAGFDRLFELL